MIRRTTAAAAAALLVFALGACAAPAAPAAEPTASPSAPEGETVVYRTIDGVDLSADVCEPEDDGEARAAMILLHGGGFTEGSRKSVGELCRQFAKMGVVGFAIDYRLLPDHPYPAPVEDANAAVAWLQQPEISAAYGVDPTRIGMLGSSAGAIITATVATEAESGLAVAAALSPVADMTTSGLLLGSPTPAAAATILAYLGCASLDDCPQSAEASPLTSVSEGDVPLFLAVGSKELVPREQVEALHDALVANGVPTDLAVVSGERHGLALLSDDVRAKMFEFVSEHLAS